MYAAKHCNYNKMKKVLAEFYHSSRGRSKTCQLLTKWVLNPEVTFEEFGSKVFEKNVRHSFLILANLSQMAICHGSCSCNGTSELKCFNL